jgi:medium-chain acyl-[acyl-carrier-protein] hydrolase
MNQTHLPASNAWLRFHQRNPAAAQLRLFCFPYAGGSASVYRNWTDLPPEIEVCPVQLPGRDERFHEPAFTRADALCDALVVALADFLDMPFAVFGHSMGAIIGYEFTRRLHARGFVPRQLLVSGQRAPHIPLRRKQSYGLCDPAFKNRLRELDGTPEVVLQDAELMEFLLPRLRSDFELSETYVDTNDVPLSCPIAAFGGAQDNEVSRSDLLAWRHVTTNAFDIRILPGGHFFLDQEGQALRRCIAARLLDPDAASITRS